MTKCTIACPPRFFEVVPPLLTKPEILNPKIGALLLRTGLRGLLWCSYFQDPYTEYCIGFY